MQNASHVSKFIDKMLVVLLCLATSASFAYDSGGSSLGSAAANLFGATSILMRVMWAACIVVGILLLMIALAHYQTHRQNPKLMPLANPITYLLLGIITLGIPFADRIFGFEDATPDDKQSYYKYE